MPIARPTWVTVRTILAVNLGEVDGLGQGKFLIEWHADNVTVIVPEMETAVLTYRKEYIAPVGADARLGRTLVQ